MITALYFGLGFVGGYRPSEVEPQNHVAPYRARNRRREKRELRDIRDLEQLMEMMRNGTLAVRR